MIVNQKQFTPYKHYTTKPRKIQAEVINMKAYMIEIIRSHWYYEDGVLESKSESEVKEIFESLIDWVE